MSTIEQLWPDATSVQLVGRGAASVPGALDLGVVPGAARARLLVPLGRRATAAALARYSAALSLRETAQRNVVGLVTRAIGPALLGDRVRIEDPGEDSISSVVSRIVGTPVDLSLGIGTARANRKPVLGAFDQHGRPVAFVKVGERAVSTEHVRAEAAALARVGSQPWQLLEVPRLLGEEQWRGLQVVVITALRPPAWQGRDGRWPIPDDAIDEICAMFDEGERPLEATPFWGRVLEVPGQLVDASAAARLQGALDVLGQRLGPTPVRVGAWHGDLTPWNLARVGGRYMIWDWERFETGVPAGLDRVHYAVNTLSRERGFGVATVLEGLRRGAPAPAPAGPAAVAVVAAYLAAITTRYLLGAQEPGGEVVATRAHVMLDVLGAFADAVGCGSDERPSFEGPSTERPGDAPEEGKTP
jgi:hypothetical protein